jgi:hypothetical protein
MSIMNCLLTLGRKVSSQAVEAGYDINSKAYRLLLVASNKIVVSRDVVFDESVKPSPAVAESTKPVGTNDDISDSDSDDDVPPLLEEDSGSDSCSDSDTDSDVDDDDDGDAAAPPAAVPAAAAHPQADVRRSTRERRPVGQWWQASASSASASVPVCDDPATVKEALASDAADLWKKAMDEELASLLENDTWTVESVPDGVKSLPCKWVFKIKRDAQGNIERYKARLVAKGYRQVEGVGYEEVYAPVSKHSSLRALLAIVAQEDYELHQLDVKTAFLNGILEEDIWMCHPPGFEQGLAGTACKLKKALYSLKQPPCQ